MTQESADARPSIASRLRSLRAVRQLSSAAVAEALGWKPRTYSSYESGDSEPSSTRVAALADFYGVSADYLLGRSDSPQGVDPGRWIIDLDAIDENRGTWCAQVPRRYRIVSYEEMRRMEEEL